MQHLFLDTNLLGQLCHPTAEKFKDLKHWAYAILEQSASEIYQLCLPEIVDYELRRKRLHMALQQGRNESNSLTRLNNFKKILRYLPLQTSTMHLAAQAKELNGIVLTTNQKHLSRFVPVADWQSFRP